MIPEGKLPLQNGVPGFCPCPLALGLGPVQLLMDFAFASLGLLALMTLLYFSLSTLFYQLHWFGDLEPMRNTSQTVSCCNPPCCCLYSPSQPL